MTGPFPSRPRRNKAGATPYRWWLPLVVRLRFERPQKVTSDRDHGRVVAVIGE